jgi:hypothetical protein
MTKIKELSEEGLKRKIIDLVAMTIGQRERLLLEKAKEAAREVIKEYLEYFEKEGRAK